jgi:hypothetical protein
MQLFEVDFSVKINGYFQTVKKELIFANSVSECKKLAERFLDNFKNKQDIHIFIEA